MKKLLLILVLFGFIFNSCDAQRNYTAKKLLFGQVQKPYINYGYLYNWWAVIGDTDGDNVSETSIANTGWHVPTTTDWSIIETYVNGGTPPSPSSNTVGGKLKQVDLVYWNSPNTGATNEFK